MQWRINIMYNDNNTLTHFECEIDNLSYCKIEREISKYFNMGYPDNSDIPIEMQEGIGETCTLICTKKRGKFNISIYKLKNGKYQLSATLQGKLSNS